VSGFSAEISAALDVYPAQELAPHTSRNHMVVGHGVQRNKLATGLLARLMMQLASLNQASAAIAIRL